MSDLTGIRMGVQMREQRARMRVEPGASVLLPGLQRQGEPSRRKKKGNRITIVLVLILRVGLSLLL